MLWLVFLLVLGKVKFKSQTALGGCLLGLLVLLGLRRQIMPVLFRLVFGFREQQEIEHFKFGRMIKQLARFRNQ